MARGVVLLEVLMEVGPPRNDLVLIVEDEPDNREIMRVVGEDLLGYSAATVAEGGEAVETAVKRCPAVVLMDLMLPGVDGFDAIRRIKSNPATSKIPVIAV